MGDHRHCRWKVVFTCASAATLRPHLPPQTSCRLWVSTKVNSWHSDASQSSAETTVNFSIWKKTKWSGCFWVWACIWMHINHTAAYLFHSRSCVIVWWVICQKERQTLKMTYYLNKNRCPWFWCAMYTGSGEVTGSQHVLGLHVWTMTVIIIDCVTLSLVSTNYLLFSSTEDSPWL